MLWANLIRVNISGLILFLELASGVTGSPTSCSQPYEGVIPQFTHRSGESPAPSSKWQVPSGGRVGRRASHAHSLLGLAALLLVCDKGWRFPAAWPAPGLCGPAPGWRGVRGTPGHAFGKLPSCWLQAIPPPAGPRKGAGLGLAVSARGPWGGCVI